MEVQFIGCDHFGSTVHWLWSLWLWSLWKYSSLTVITGSTVHWLWSLEVQFTGPTITGGRPKVYWPVITGSTVYWPVITGSTVYWPAITGSWPVITSIRSSGRCSRWTCDRPCLTGVCSTRVHRSAHAWASHGYSMIAGWPETMATPLNAEWPCYWRPRWKNSDRINHRWSSLWITMVTCTRQMIVGSISTAK